MGCQEDLDCLGWYHPSVLLRLVAAMMMNGEDHQGDRVGTLIKRTQVHVVGNGMVYYYTVIPHW